MLGKLPRAPWSYRRKQLGRRHLQKLLVGVRGLGCRSVWRRWKARCCTSSRDRYRAAQGNGRRAVELGKLPRAPWTAVSSETS